MESIAMEQHYLFGSVVMKIREHLGVWKLTSHGEALGVAMAKIPKDICGKSIIEIGTGSGAHAILALKLGASQIDITDNDPVALDAAERNAKLNGVAFRNVLRADWMRIDPPEAYDIVLCNPPFAKAATRDRRYFISTLIEESPRFLRPGGTLIFCQSSMADFSATENELASRGFTSRHIHVSRAIFRDYYFSEPGFIEVSRKVPNGFEQIDGVFVETLKVFCARYTN